MMSARENNENKAFIQVSKVHCNGGRKVFSTEGSSGLLTLSSERKFTINKELQNVVGVEMKGLSVPPATMLLGKGDPINFTVRIYFKSR